MLPVLQVGPLAIQLPGLILLAGVWFAILAAERTAAGRGVVPDRVTSLIMISLVAGIMGARLGYALRFLDLYLDRPLALLALNPNTLAGFEGLVVGVLAGLTYAQRRKLPLLTVLDVLAPGLALFMIALGLAHLASGDAFGAPTSLPWAIELWGAERHPSQLYETLLAGLIFWLTLKLEQRTAFDGFLFTSLVALQAAGRLFLEAFRGDSRIIAESLRVAQLASLGLLAASLLALHLLRRRSAQGDAGREGRPL
jgi:phosphatidylglycerol:prolipoprotein diacylglycerol transferase